MRTFLILAILLAGTAARAGETGYLIDGSDVDSIVEIARNYGSATIETQVSGNPKIAARAENTAYAVYFQNCSAPRACDDMNLYAGFLNSHPTAELINDWNMKKRFGRAYIDPDGDAALEMDINLKNGVSPANLSASFAIWRLMLVQFTAHIGVQN